MHPRASYQGEGKKLHAGCRASDQRDADAAPHGEELVLAGRGGIFFFLGDPWLGWLWCGIVGDRWEEVQLWREEGGELDGELRGGDIRNWAIVLLWEGVEGRGTDALIEISKRTYSDPDPESDEIEIGDNGPLGALTANE